MHIQVYLDLHLACYCISPNILSILSDSPLDLAILNLFVVLRIRFRNMVSGAITRSSVRRAFERGLTSDLIIKYLTMHAHPELLRQVRHFER